jgi:hypothetical protein
VFDKHNYELNTYLHLRSSEEEVAHYLRLAGAEFLSCVQDRHFEQFVFKDIITADQVMAVVQMLNADRIAMEGGDTKFFCQKTYGLPKDLRKDMEKFPNLTGAYWLASIRRIHCSCHNVGDFSLSTNWYNKMHHLYKDTKGKSQWFT